MYEHIRDCRSLALLRACLCFVYESFLKLFFCYFFFYTLLVYAGILGYIKYFVFVLRFIEVRIVSVLLLVYVQCKSFYDCFCFC